MTSAGFTLRHRALQKPKGICGLQRRTGPIHGFMMRNLRTLFARSQDCNIMRSRIGEETSMPFTWINECHFNIFQVEELPSCEGTVRTILFFASESKLRICIGRPHNN